MDMTEQDRVAALVKREASSIRPTERVQLLEKQLMSPVSERRQYATAGGSATAVVWIVARIDTKVGVAYSEDGYGAEGIPWGLVFLGASSFGDSGAWYRSLQELVDDCGYY